MSSNRKYSRSRSPIDERSNSRKQDYPRRKHSPSSYRQEHSSERSRDYDHDRRRSRHHASDDTRDRRHDRARERRDDRYKDSTTSSSRELDGSRLSSSSAKLDDRQFSASPRRLHTSSEHRGVDLKFERTLDTDYGRLKPTIKHTESLSSPTSETDQPRKRKADDQGESRAVDTDKPGRRSRFDKAEPPRVEHTTGPVIPSRSSIVADKRITNDSNKTSMAKKEVTANTDEEKLRQRQERLALWKQKKADEAAKQTSNSEIPSSNISTTALHRPTSFSPVAAFKSALESPPKLPPQTELKTSSGIGKFGMASKHLAASSSTVSHKPFGFSDEIDSRRVLPSIETVEPVVRTIDSNAGPPGVAAEIDESRMKVQEKDEDEDIDPLDAFMAENSAALDKTSGTTRSAGDVINDQEYDTGFEVSEEEDILALAAKRIALKKKDIVTINHSLQDYEPFRKDFYVEPEELADLTEAEVDAMRLELDGIVIRGKECPKPVTHWGQCGLSADTLDQIQQLGYTSPTSIQAQAIPAIMAGRDTIGVAKTGSGKTMAFLLPMFRHIKDQRPLESSEGPIGMILTPTRELAVQIHKECKPFLKALDLRAVCVYGGPPIKEQIAEFKRGAEIVVCTPGRMIDILAANQGRVTNLKRITYTVLDEADRMFDLGFEPQVMKILNNIRPQRQTVLFSATFPKSMEALARKILRGKPVEITVGARSVVAPEITQKIEIRPKDSDTTKFNRVLEILGELYNTDEDARTLIFVDRQEAADSLLYQLMRKGYPCNALHGGKDQYDRDSTISDFKAGIFPILVATSVAARGLDVKQLKLVINYDCPNHMEDYVHRVGRTGRAGNTGTAITFISEDQERYAFDIAKALRLSQVDIPAPLKVLADAFAEKVKAGIEKGSAAGFGGKGLAKFDTARDHEKRVQRKIYGEDEDIEEESAVRKAELSDDDNESAHDSDRVNPDEAQAVAEMGTSASADAPIKVEKVTAQMRQATGAKPNVGTKALDPVAAARARIDAINNRIKTGTKPLEQAASNPDAGEYRAMMEINDYPQKARWNVTNRTNIAKVLEATGTSITTQGQYVKPGSSAPAGVPKLYLLVEGPTELCVTDAVKELRRLLAEGTLADADAAGTRYKVV